MDDTLTAVSLFAGVGGFDLAAQMAGIRVVAAVEIDTNARGVLAHRFPQTHLFDDVRTVTPDGLRAAGFIPERGVILGGFPCQDLSVAGRREGLAGERSGLFWEIVRLIDELSPKWVVLENVPGLLSSNGGRDMGTVVGAMERRGYGVAWRVLDAAGFGVPQRRRRLFLVCHSGDDGLAPVSVLSEPDRGVGNPSQGVAQGQDTPSEAPRGSDGTSGAGDLFRLRAFGDYVEDSVTSNLQSRDYKSATDLVATDAVGVLGGGSETLIAGPVTDKTVPIAFSAGNSAKAYGIGLSEDVAPPLRAGASGTNQVPTVMYEATSSPAVAVSDAVGVLGERAHTLTAEGHDASEDGTGRGNPVVAYAIGFQPTDGGFANYNDNGLSTTIKASDGPAVAYSVREDAEPTPAVLMRQREGKPGGGKGPLLSEETSLTIATSNDQVLFQTLGADSATFVKARRAQSAEDPETWREDEIAPTLNTFDGGDSRTTVIAVRDAVDAFDEMNFNLRGQVHQTLRAGTNQSTGVVTGTIVRRLTPTECERLQGFPDGWTAERLDFKTGHVVAQKDSARFKQMGNAVAVPCVAWILRRLAATHHALKENP